MSKDEKVFELVRGIVNKIHEAEGLMDSLGELSVQGEISPVEKDLIYLDKATESFEDVRIQIRGRFLPTS